MNMKQLIAGISAITILGSVLAMPAYAEDNYTVIKDGKEVAVEEKDYEILHMISKPNKLVYEIGEELDFTGGTAEISGKTDGALWDTFEQPLTNEEYFVIDASNFNNKKVGTYDIYVLTTSGKSKESFQVEVVKEIEHIAGDADGSGEVDILDVITINKAIMGKENLPASGLKAIDFNHNSKPDADEALTLLKYIVGLIEDFTA